MAAKKKGKKKAAKAARKAAKKAAKKAVKQAAKSARTTSPAKAATKATPAAKAAAPAHNPWKSYADKLAREMATTLKVMRAYPEDQTGFQPHPRSASAMQLCWTFAIEQGVVLDAINGTLKMPPSFGPPPATLTAVIATFEGRVNAVLAAARGAAPATYERPTQFFTGPGQMANVPAGAIAQLMLNDQIHHRGQLSVYLRMAGGKVPSIYGPSADEPW